MPFGMENRGSGGMAAPPGGAQHPKSNWLSILPALVGAAAGAIGGPDSAMGQGGLGFTQGYVGQLLKRDEEERRKKDVFEGLMQKTAWDNFQNLDGVDLSQIDVDPMIRQQIMDYSQAVKDAIGSDGVISPKEAVNLNALYSAVAEPIRQMKERRGVVSAAQSASAGEAAGVHQNIMQAFPGADAQQQISTMFPGAFPSIEDLKGGTPPITSPDAARAAAEQHILQQRRQAEVQKLSMVPMRGPDGSIFYAPPGAAVSGMNQQANRDQRAQLAREKMRSQEGMLKTRLQAAAQRRGWDITKEAGAMNAYVANVLKEAADYDLEGTPESQQKAIAQALSNRPFVMKNGNVLRGEEVWGMLGQGGNLGGNPLAMTAPPTPLAPSAGAPNYTNDELQELLGAIKSGKPLTPRQQEIVSALQAEGNASGDLTSAK